MLQFHSRKKKEIKILEEKKNVYFKGKNKEKRIKIVPYKTRTQQTKHN